MGEATPRVVTFTYDVTLKSLATMSYGGRTWTYTQSSVDGMYGNFAKAGFGNGIWQSPGYFLEG